MKVTSLLIQWMNVEVKKKNEPSPPPLVHWDVKHCWIVLRQCWLPTWRDSPLPYSLTLLEPDWKQRSGNNSQLSVEELLQPATAPRVVFTPTPLTSACNPCSVTRLPPLLDKEPKGIIQIAIQFGAYWMDLRAVFNYGLRIAPKPLQGVESSPVYSTQSYRGISVSHSAESQCRLDQWIVCREIFWYY